MIHHRGTGRRLFTTEAQRTQRKTGEERMNE
jgi:hypothetical protein